MRSRENDIVIGQQRSRDQGRVGGDNGPDVRQVEAGQWSPVAIITPDITHQPRENRGSRPTSFLPSQLLITTGSRERATTELPEPKMLLTGECDP